MAGVRSILNCIDVDASGHVSLLRDLFGFERRRVPTDPDATLTASVSLLRLMRDLKEDHIHLNVIRVGFDMVADQDEAGEKLDWAILRIREIYQQVSLGVGRVEHYVITSAAADGTDDLGSEDEADELSDDWTVHNDAIDVFVVRNISDADFVGISPIGGSCDKDAKNDGLIGGEIGRTFDRVARTFAHEVGHFLGLPHNHDDGDCPTTTSGKNNLMAQTGCVISVRTSVNLSSSQGSDMRAHCSVRGGC